MAAIRAELDRVLSARPSSRPSRIATDVKTITRTTAGRRSFSSASGSDPSATSRAVPRPGASVRKVPGPEDGDVLDLRAGQASAAHRGPYNGVLRLHLGLIVPPEPHELGIRVGTICHWQEGEALSSTTPTSTRPGTRRDETRVVLFVDFVKPLRFPANLLNWLLLNIAVFTPFIREGHGQPAGMGEEVLCRGRGAPEAGLRWPQPKTQGCPRSGLALLWMRNWRHSYARVGSLRVCDHACAPR